MEKGAYFRRFGRARGISFLWFFAGTLMFFWGPFLSGESWAIEDQVESVEKGIRAVKEAVKEVVKIGPEESKTDFVIMPIPISNPTIGTGLGAAAMFLYPVDNKSPVSSTTAGGFYTSNDSWGAGVNQKTFLYEDRLRLNGLAGYGNINLHFYGVGTDAGNRGISVPITEKGFFFIPEGLTRIAGRLYGGVRYRYLEMESAVNLQELLNNKIDIPPISSKVRSSGMGLVLNYDSRDNPFNPYKGTFLDLNAIFPSKALGGDYDYQIYQAAYNFYYELADHMVLAYRAFGKFTAGDVPFFDLSFFGTHNDLRGYPGGRYLDKMMLATQLEYRWKFYKRWGMVVFAGVGEVARNLSDFSTKDLLPSAGAGLRFMVSEKNRVNVSLDYARGREGDAVYFYIGEAF